MKHFLLISLYISILLLYSFGVYGQLTLEVSVKHVKCPNGNDAELTINYTGGGSGNIVVQWENSAKSESDYIVVKGSSATVTFPWESDKKVPISSGNLLVSVVDVGSAPQVQNVASSILVFEPQVIDYSVTQPTKEKPTGSIYLETPLRKDFYNYQFSIDGDDNLQDDLLFDKLEPGNYNLKVRITSPTSICNFEEMVKIVTPSSN